MFPLTTRRDSRYAGVALALAIALFGPESASAQRGAPSVALPFVSVQTELLAVPNSYSNAWGDYDNDGDLDLAVSLGSGEVRLYRNDKGVLVSVGAELGMPRAGSHELRGLSWGDDDHDGFIDLLGGATARDKLTVVLRNEGGKRFTNVAAAIGLTIPDRSARQTNWVDYDNDGDLDVYATDRAGDNMLFRNDKGIFTHVFVGVGPTDARPTVGACRFDMDKDGDLDLFLANQAGASDALWRNDGTSFTDVAPALGLTGPPRTTAQGGVGRAVGDYDNDGGLDLTVTDGYDPMGGHFVFRNTLPELVRKRSLSVLVLDAAGHQTRFGAEVRLYDRSGTLLASRRVLTGGGYNTQRAAPVHFGLAKPQRVDVRVTFMSRDGPKAMTVIGVDPSQCAGKSLVIRQPR